MTVYAQGTSPEETVHSDWLAVELAKIGAGFYINMAIQAPKALVEDIVATEVQGTCVVPYACTLSAVRAACTLENGTVASTCDIYDELLTTPATILTGAITLSAKTKLTGTLAAAKTTRVAGDLLGLRVVTDGDNDDGDVNGLSVSIWAQVTTT